MKYTHINGGPPPPVTSGDLLLIQPNPFVALFAIDLPTSPLTKFRVTAYPETLYFERTSLGAAIPYYPFSIGLEESRADAEGGIQKVRVTAQNVSREAIALAESYNGLIGQRLRYVIVRRDELPDAVPRVREDFEIVEANFTESTAEFVCGRTALQLKKLLRRVSRTHCQHAYGRAGCGYDTTRGGALQSCDFTLEGANGCYVHGDDEEAAGRPNLHDRNGATRALIFPGVARSTGVATT